MCKDTVALGPLPAMVMQDFFIFWQVFRTVKFLKFDIIILRVQCLAGDVPICGSYLFILSHL